MTIRAQFYAHLRDAAGSSFVDIDIAEGGTVRELLEQIYAKIPALRAHDKTILVAVGLELVGRKHKVRAGDEISIMPPVQGG
jgi:molybdopterin converting factor small subunit